MKRFVLILGFIGYNNIIQSQHSPTQEILQNNPVNLLIAAIDGSDLEELKRALAANVDLNKPYVHTGCYGNFVTPLGHAIKVHYSCSSSEKKNDSLLVIHEILSTNKVKEPYVWTDSHAKLTALNLVLRLASGNTSLQFLSCPIIELLLKETTIDWLRYPDIDQGEHDAPFISENSVDLVWLNINKLVQRTPKLLSVGIIKDRLKALWYIDPDLSSINAYYKGARNKNLTTNPEIVGANTILLQNVRQLLRDMIEVLPELDTRVPSLKRWSGINKFVLQGILEEMADKVADPDEQKKKDEILTEKLLSKSLLAHVYPQFAPAPSINHQLMFMEMTGNPKQSMRAFLPEQ